MEWPSGYILGIAAIVCFGAAVALSSGSDPLGVLSLTFLALVGLVILWFQLRRGAERARAQQRLDS